MCFKLFSSAVVMQDTALFIFTEEFLNPSKPRILHNPAILSIKKGSIFSCDDMNVDIV